jgi:hypothetical protein
MAQSVAIAPLIAAQITQAGKTPMAHVAAQTAAEYALTPFALKQPYQQANPEVT